MKNDKLIDDILKDVKDELNNALNKHPEYPDDVLHAVAIINEEVGELNKALLQHVYEGEYNVSVDDIKKEGIQTIVTALRLLYSIDTKNASFVKSLTHYQ